MSVEISKNAELLYKALEDVWSAEQLWRGSPNNAVWHCCQAIEKALKGALKCYHKDYEYGHVLADLLDQFDDIDDCRFGEQTVKYIMYLNRFGVGLRYKNMKSDPTKEDARVAIDRAVAVIEQISKFNKVEPFVREAKEVLDKIIKNI